MILVIVAAAGIVLVFGGYLLIRGFFKLRAFHQRFGISLPALLLLFARRYVLCLRRHHSTKPLPFQKAFPNLKISVQAHAQLRRLFRKYTSGELRMSLKQWLQFKREEQKEFDEAAASEEFVRLQHAATRDMASCCVIRIRGWTARAPSSGR